MREAASNGTESLNNRPPCSHWRPICLPPKEAASLPCLIQVNEDRALLGLGRPIIHSTGHGGKQTRGQPATAENKREASQSGITVDTLRSFTMYVAGRMLFAVVIALVSLSAMSLQRDDQSANDTEIRIGNLTPYTGPLAEFSTIGKAEAGYFDMINDRGGINGHKVRFISYDDNSDPTVALDLPRVQVERDNVLLMFGSFGTAGNLAVRSFLNERKVPQLFVASGAEELGDPKAFPLTMGWQPSFRAEGRIYANYIQAFYPQRNIVALWQNDQFGRDLFKGIQEGLGNLTRLIIVDVAFDMSDRFIDGHG